MKPFDLKAAKAGAPICTRDGRPVRILCFDAKHNYPIKALINTDNIREDFAEYTINGEFYNNQTEDSFDLMMAPLKHEGWINIYNSTTGFITGYKIYDSKEEAISYHNVESTDYHTIKIEWEE